MDESIDVLATDAATATSHADEPGHGAPVTAVGAVGTDDQAATEQLLAELLAQVLHQDRVAPDSNFFDDLAANSLLMAHFCARVRKRPELPTVSIKDVYRHPTVRSLATALLDAPPPGRAAADPGERATTASPPVPASRSRYVLCGVLQALVFLGYSAVVAFVTGTGYQWISDGSGATDVYLRSLLFGSGGFVFLCAFPVAAKWVLIGRWKAGEFDLWSLRYLRFWTVKTLVHANPMVLFAGNPLYLLYLRALGARIGKDVTILSRSVPICSDLLTVGDGTVVRKDAFIQCYRAHGGRIQTGPVTLGRDVLVGEKTVLDVRTSMGDGSQLGHASALQAGETVPAGECWQGSPAQRTVPDGTRVPAADCGSLRRVGYGLMTALQVLLVYVPLAFGGTYLLLTLVPRLSDLLGPDAGTITSGALVVDALVLSLVLFVGGVAGGLAVVLTVPQLLDRAIEPGRVYPLYGLHYTLHRTIARLTNVKFYPKLFGDSSYIVAYLRWLGYDVSSEEQTGSNFGTELAHENPFLTSVGAGTMVCDGLSVLNADYSATSFRLSRVSIGAHNFLGNNIAFPPGARTGEDCLLATKVLVPTEGPVWSHTGLLGSPSFEIPRSVERDSRFDHLRSGPAHDAALAAKNRYNRRSMVWFLLVRWGHVFLLTVFGLVALDLYDAIGHLVIAADLALSLVVSAGYFVLVERAMARFRPLEPRFCSIYDPYYWWHERLWKAPDAYLTAFNGTPFKNLVWRLLGVSVGHRVFDDGCYLTERTLSTLSDGCTLNVGSKVQCHSLEDGTFKSDRTTVGAGATLGVGAFVHYGVVVGDGAVVAADSFLMKGEQVSPLAEWAGNPAREVRAGLRQPSGAER